MSRRSCGVIVCAFTDERWDDIGAALGGLARQTVLPDQVVLVIDHNPALLAKALIAFPNVTVIPNEEKRGLSGGRNTGVANIHCDVIAFLDDDAVPAENWIERTLAAYDDPAVLATGGLIIPIWPTGQRPAWMPPEYDWTVGCSYVGLPTQREPVRNPIGANMSFRREVFDLVEPFDSSVGRSGGRPIGCEETELCIRIRQAKPEAIVLYDPSIVVQHRVTPTRTQWRYFRSRCFAEGLSKATVSSLVGASDGLSAERSYAARVLTNAMRREARLAVGGDGDAARRMGAVFLGAATAGAGYLQGASGIRLREARRLRKERRDDRLDALPADDFLPMKVLDVDLADTSPPDVGPNTQSTYQQAHLLVRRNGRPVAQVSVDLAAAELDPPSLRRDFAQSPVELPCHHSLTDRTLTVVVPTRNRPGSLSELLESIVALRDPVEVVVVDNAPHLPHAAAVVARFAEHHPWIRYVAEERTGASRARNRGLANVTTRYVAFTDDDVVVDSRWVSGLLSGFAVAPNVMCVTGLVVPVELETQAQVWFEEFGGFGKGTEPRVFDANYDGGPLYPFSAGAFGSGNNVAFDVAALRGVGGYDERLGPGTPTRAGEDLELFIRTVRSGGSIAYQPAAVVWHRHRRTVSELHRQLTDYGVGLISAIAMQALSDPVAALKVLRRLPAGAKFLVSPKSSRNHRRSATFPTELSRAELFGVLIGPFALARSVIAGRQHDDP